MSKKNNEKEFAEALGAVGAFVAGGLVLIGGMVGFVAVTVLLVPIMYYLVGMLASATFWGDWIVSGAGKLGVDIVKGDLPVIFAALGALGGFFRSHLKTTAKKAE